MKNRITLTIALLLLSFTIQAQNTHFVNQGIITYEKKVNIYALIKDQLKRYPNDSWGTKAFEEYQKNNPQFKTLKSNLTFRKDQTYFNPLPDESLSSGWFNFLSAKQNNIISTNLTEGKSTAQKSIYEATYLLKDTLRKINWKITDEFREIAGYNCRRANALIMDSIYVVAFYSEKIPVSGGPESFSGLPGMILGVALPYEHITWFATEIKDITVTEEQLKTPTKGKPIDKAQFTKTLKDATKDWGNYAQDVLKSAEL